MNHTRIFYCLLFISEIIFAQHKIELIRSQEVLENGRRLIESGRFEDAMREYMKVPIYDSNYSKVQIELANAYFNMKDFSKCKEVCLNLLQSPIDDKVQIVRLLAASYNGTQQFEESQSLLRQAIKEFPVDYLLRFSLGLSYFLSKEYAKAEKAFYEVLRINPFHPGSHLYLGYLAALEGKKTRAMMSLGFYLALNEEDSRQLDFLERLLKNQINDEGSITYSPQNAFSEPDEQLRSGTVLRTKIKSSLPSKSIVTQHFLYFFSKIDKLKNDPKDDWCVFYLPLYQEIARQKLHEAYICHITSSSQDAATEKWKEKNKERLTTLYDLANSHLYAFRRMQYFPEFGFEQPVKAWFMKENRIEALGLEDAQGKKTGYWMLFEDNSQVAAEGYYEKGEKTGIWKYYYKNGRLREINDLTSGKVEFYHADGYMLYRYNLVNNRPHGLVEIFYPCGALQEKLEYNNGLRQGPGVILYESGKTKQTYFYEKNMLQGNVNMYYANGLLNISKQFKEDKLDGDYHEYYPNGNLKSEGKFSKDYPVGHWRYFHPNGKMEKEGAFGQQGKWVGDWNFYNPRGRLIENITYDSAGNPTGENKIYRNGKLFIVFHYKQGLLTRVVYYDESGHIIEEFGSDDGTFVLKGFYPTGELKYTGQMVNGKRAGEWIYHYRSGIRESVSEYLNDKLHGKYISYYKNGSIKMQGTYVNDQADGYYTEYHINGNLKSEGWFINGRREQKWVFYYANGELESEHNYANGNLEGKALVFGPGGRLHSSILYKNDKIQSLCYFTDAGDTLFCQTNGIKGFAMETHYRNNQRHFQASVNCGEFDRDFKQFYPNATPYQEVSYQHGNRAGSYQMFYLHGIPLVKGKFVENEQDGQWTWYNELGRKTSETFFYLGERDSTVFYHLNQKIAAVLRYTDDNRDGLTQYFSPSGELIMEKLFDNEELITYRVREKNGLVGEWKKFIPNLTITAYHTNGRKALEENYRNSLLNGPQNDYYENGVLMSSIKYTDGNQDGPFAIYYPTGKVLQKGNYLHNDMHGKVETYYENGGLMLEVNFFYGTKSGPMIYYSPKGVQASEVVFFKDTPARY